MSRMESVPLLLSKYTFRTIHMATYALIFGNLMLDYFFGQRSKSISATGRSNYVLLHVASSILLVISGIINMIILVVENKYEKNLAYTAWKNILIAKFFLSLVLTPILEKFLPLKYFTDKNVSSLLIEEKASIYFNVRVAVTLGLFLISPFTRYLREYGMKPGKNIKIQ